MRVRPLTLRQGSLAHRAYVVIPWLLVAAVAVYVPLAAEIGFTPGSIDKVARIAQINDVIAFAVAILGLDLVIGYSGQLSLGQSAFVGLGAYTTVILVTDHDWSYYAAIPATAVVCGVAGLLIGAPATRFAGAYLAMVTLGLAYVFPSLVLRFEWLTGGPNGKGPGRDGAELRPPSWMPFADDSRMAGPLWVYCLSVVMAGVLFLLARNFIRSRRGRALIAVRDNPASATAMGISAPMYKALAFAASAVYGGLAGAMLMMNRPFASDVQFGTNMALFLVVGLVIGGLGTISGAAVGAFVYLFVPHFVRQWTFDQSGMPPGLRELTSPLFAWLDPAGGGAVGIVFGLALLVLMFLMPGGFIAGMRRIKGRLVTIVPKPPVSASARSPAGTPCRTDA